MAEVFNGSPKSSKPAPTSDESKREKKNGLVQHSVVSASTSNELVLGKQNVKDNKTCLIIDEKHNDNFNLESNSYQTVKRVDHSAAFEALIARLQRCKFLANPTICSGVRRSSTEQDGISVPTPATHPSTSKDKAIAEDDHLATVSSECVLSTFSRTMVSESASSRTCAGGKVCENRCCLSSVSTSTAVDASIGDLSTAISDHVATIHRMQNKDAEHDDDLIDIVLYDNELQMPDIMRLITKDLSEPYSIYTYRYFIHNWPNLCFLAKLRHSPAEPSDENNCLVGAIVCKFALHTKGTRRGYIAMLAVDERYRRRRIGTRLVSRAIETMVELGCDEVVLETEVTNHYALKLLNMRRNPELQPAEVLRQMADFVHHVVTLLKDDYSEEACKTLTEHLSEIVPRIYKPNANPRNLINDEKSAQTYLLDPLTHIICGEPDVTFDKYAARFNISTQRPGQICGQLFRNGEATYSCQECATDPTCVMCFECFSQTQHKSHKYKMHASNGKGYCDCGDTEAWRCEPSCQRHRPIQTDGSSKEAEGIPKLSPSEERRVRVIVNHLLQYAVQLLCCNCSDSLPLGLIHQPMCLPYQTMLFNDESHTYEQVIKALTRAISCNDDSAMFLATVVDREGRSSVKSGSKEECEQAKTIIEQRTARDSSKGPLLVQTMDSNLVAHQAFAIRLLHWMSDSIKALPPLLSIVSQSLMRETVPHVTDANETTINTLVATLMKQDFKLWKSARAATHELLMGTVLMDAEVKRDFAKLFASLYSDLVQKHIDDDHDHKLSITALSVQIFTAPTIARLLIAEENVLCLVIRTFLASLRNVTSKGRFSFQRAANDLGPKRGLFALSDAKYLLSVPPNANEWTESLRQKFLSGFSAILEVLLCMQGMDEVVRQLNQHQEWEPEWETAFNIQIRLSPVLALMQRWTVTDKSCLVVSFNETMKCLYQTELPTVVKKLGDREVRCIDYEVARQAVSVHLPLSRLLAGLYLNFEKFDLTLTSAEVTAGRSTLSIERLIELPLRTIVLMAQTTAGLWRRNGYALLNQIHNYQSPLCRSEMYDKDIIMLQMGAANMESNEYLIRLLHKFGLLRWADRPGQVEEVREEDTMKQMLTMAEEFLHLLLIVIGERWVPGISAVTKDDVIRREVLHILCRGSAPYSKIDKHLPEDHLEKTGLEQVIRSVADFRQPSGTSAGVFELKLVCRSEYNPFFYHYSKSDMSKAEEHQRKIRKDCSPEVRACAPPLPPLFLEQFANIVNIFTCDTMLRILTNVLIRAKSYDCWHTDGQLHRTLQLIGLALREEQRQNEMERLTTQRRASNSHLPSDEHMQTKFPKLSFTRTAMKWAEAKKELNLLDLMVNLLDQAQTQYYQDLLKWMISKFREVFGSRDLVEIESQSPDQSFGMERTDEDGTDGEQERKRRRHEIACKHRQRAMEQMQRLQKHFVQKNCTLLDNAESSAPVAEEEEMETEGSQLAPGEQFPVCLGPKRSRIAEIPGRRVSCVLCQESQEVTFDDRPIVLAAFVQPSALFSQSRDKVIDKPDHFNPLYVPSDLYHGVLTSTCGHTMHPECWQHFYDTFLLKEQRRPLRWRFGVVLDIDYGEYLCPLCKRLSNSVLPLLPSLKKLNFDKLPSADVTYENWFSGMETVVSAALSHCQRVFSTTRATESKSNSSADNSLQSSNQRPNDSLNLTSYLDRRVTPSASAESLLNDDVSVVGVSVLPDLLPAYSSIVNALTQRMPASVVEQLSRVWRTLTSYTDNEPMSSAYLDTLRVFSHAVYTHGLRTPLFHDSPKILVLSWLTVAYTIRCIDATLAYERKPLFGAFTARQRDCLHALVRYGAVCNLASKAAIVRRHVIRLLKLFVLANDSMPTTVVELDLFSTLVELLYSIGWLHADDENSWSIPTGGAGEYHVFRLVLKAYVLQALMTLNVEASQSSEVAEGSSLTESPEDKAVLSMLNHCNAELFAGESKTPPVHQLPKLAIKFKDILTRGFLRPSALFFHALTQVPPPEALKDPSIAEFSPLCRFLGLPDNLTELEKFIDPDSLLKWCRLPRVKEIALSGRIVKQPLSANLLVQLPHDFSELINKAALFNCPSLNNDETRSPTMCLVCGVFLCSNSYCCQKKIGGQLVGACTYHANYCAAATGIFLRVRDCHTILQYQQQRGCILPAPYVDEYGETDQGFRRGNPLRLNEELYKQLHLMWLHQSIPEEIVHKMEIAGPIVLAPEWQHL